MLNIDHQEVIAAQVSGAYALNHNERRNTNLYIDGPAQFLFTDNFGFPNYQVPITKDNSGYMRSGHIIVILDGDIVEGCLLR